MDMALTPEQTAMQAHAYEVGLALRPQVAEWDRLNQAPYAAVVRHVADSGLLGLAIPKRFGGQGRTSLDYMLAVEALFRGSQFWVVGEPLFATTGPGPSMLLLAEQDATRNKFLPDVVTGVRQCAIALTEPGHGSDLAALESFAKKDNSGYIVNGSKNYVTGATVNQLYAAFVRFDDIQGHRGIGAVILEEGMPGLEIEAGPEFTGCRGVPHGNLFMHDVHIPEENVIVGPGQFSRLMTAFNMERLHNTTFNMSMAECAYDEAVNFVENRQAFGRSVIEFQAVRHSLVDMWTDIEALRMLAYQAASTAIDGNFPAALPVSIAKLFGARIASQVTLKALELHGGYGATKDYAVERIHRDVIASIVAGGAPAVLKDSIAATLLPSLKSRRASS